MSDPAIPVITGLHLSDNTFSASPTGALSKAINGVIPNKGVFQPRRGQERAYTPPFPTEIPFAITEFLGAAIINSAVSKENNSYTLGLAADPTVSFLGGPWNPVDNDGSTLSAGRMKFGFASGYLFFCTTTGAKVLEKVDGTLPRAAGLQDMPDLEAANVSPQLLPQTWLPYGSSVAYRSLERRPTSDGVSLLSPPSGRYVVTNRLLAPPGAMVRTAGTTVTVTIPGLVTGGLGLAVGDGFTLGPGEADFAAGAYVVASVTGDVFTYADIGANVSNTVAQDFDCGPRAVALLVFLGGSASTTSPVRLYRSISTSSATVQPSDEMYLVEEKFPSGTDITNGFVRFSDTTPDSVLSLSAQPLYTNPQSGEGATQENSEPPIYRDTAWWGQREWYAQTTSRQQFTMQMLGVGTPEGVQSGDTLTITVDGVDHVFPFGVGNVPITSASTPSVNILRTTQSLIEIINFIFSPLSGNVPLRAFYLGSQDLSLGKFLLKRTDYGDAFQVKVSRKGSWSPAFLDNVAQDSTAEYIPNGLSFSKLGQGEAVPLINRTTIGSKNFPLARIFALKQALICLKQGDGIFAATGEFPFNVQQVAISNTVAPDCAAVFSDQVWAYTDQGILRITESGGSAVVSRPIETLLNELRARFPAETYNYSFAVPYETERRIYFYVPVDVVNGEPVMGAFVYNQATETWTGPVGPAAFSGIVGPAADKLLLGVDDKVWLTGRVLEERKGNNPAYLDYADADFTATIASVVSTTEFTVTSALDIEAGDIITQSVAGTLYATLVSAVDGVTVTVLDAVPFTASTCTVFKHYDVEAQFQPWGNPVLRKTLTRLQFIFKPEWYRSRTGTAVLFTDQIQAELLVAMPSNGFGSNPFGSVPFGDPTPLMLDVNPLNPKWTNAAQFFVGLKTSEAWVKLKLQGFAAQVEGAAGPAGRGGGR